MYGEGDVIGRGTRARVIDYLGVQRRSKHLPTNNFFIFDLPALRSDQTRPQICFDQRKNNVVKCNIAKPMIISRTAFRIAQVAAVDCLTNRYQYRKWFVSFSAAGAIWKILLASYTDYYEYSLGEMIFIGNVTSIQCEGSNSDFEQDKSQDQSLPF